MYTGYVCICVIVYTGHVCIYIMLSCIQVMYVYTVCYHVYRPCMYTVCVIQVMAVLAAGTDGRTCLNPNHGFSLAFQSKSDPHAEIRSLISAALASAKSLHLSIGLFYRIQSY
ncbi:hypothetical protein FKM82_019558 [Ascaphus truei]